MQPPFTYLPFSRSVPTYTVLLHIQRTKDHYWRFDSAFLHNWPWASQSITRSHHLFYIVAQEDPARVGDLPPFPSWHVTQKSRAVWKIFIYFNSDAVIPTYLTYRIRPFLIQSMRAENIIRLNAARYLSIPKKQTCRNYDLEVPPLLRSWSYTVFPLFSIAISCTVMIGRSSFIRAWLGLRGLRGLGPMTIPLLFVTLETQHSNDTILTPRGQLAITESQTRNRTFVAS